MQIFDRPLFYSNNLTNSIRSHQSSVEQIQEQFNENHDSSISTITTNHSAHLPIEKQRGLSEVVRKRNSRFKVEDYKRSIHKSNQFDGTLNINHNNSTLISLDINSNHFDNLINLKNKQTKRSIERLNLLLSNDEQNINSNEYRQFKNDNIFLLLNFRTIEKMSVADRRNLFETISKDQQLSDNLLPSKSVKSDE